ncbi:MAG: cardiolipin synthase [Eubacteriales bacterium]
MRPIQHYLRPLGYLALYSLQLALLFFLGIALHRTPFLAHSFTVIPILTVLYIFNTPDDQAFKLSWIVVIFLFPVLGSLFYLFIGGHHITTRTKKAMRPSAHHLKETLSPLHKAKIHAPPDAHTQIHYIQQHSSTPCSSNTKTTYLPSGEATFHAMLKAIKSAKRYIFLEYFILSRGVFWQSILDLLLEKVQEGVEIRLIYDGIGSALTLPRNYHKTLTSQGIQTQIFNPVPLVLSKSIHNRDHRKLLLIDGITAFTGGLNLADEYANLAPHKPHWKDSTLHLEGESAWHMTILFLSMWEYCSKVKTPYTNFQPKTAFHFPNQGLIAPYADTPLDRELVGLTVYFNLITKARHSIYITTPYLILDATTTNALCNSAKSGVDVVIITPHIPDKKYVFHLTRAHYPHLLRAGVKIFEYSKGFIHSKLFLVDNTYATVSTVNLDYRSLFHHFENGIWMCNTPSLEAIAQDFRTTLTHCQEVTLEDTQPKNPLLSLYHSILRIFSPLM